MIQSHAEALLASKGAVIRARSRDHWTEPWGFTDDQLFLNRALLVEWEGSPEDLMSTLLSIEQQLGRQRQEGPGYAGRTIDMDILLMPPEVCATPVLTLPHPRMHERRFALAPAADIAPHWIHPRSGRSILQLLNALTTTAPQP